MTRLEEIRARLEAATPEPWDARCKEFCNLAKPRHIWSEYGWIGEFYGNSSTMDAEFIAHAPADISFLLEKLAVAERALEDIAQDQACAEYDAVTALAEIRGEG